MPLLPAMIPFSIPDSERELLLPIHRRFQAGISVLANNILRSDEVPGGIFKHEGGVTVNGSEVCIKNDYAKDDWRTSRETPYYEEMAVVTAIQELIRRVKSGDDLSEFDIQIHGDPLRSFFEGI